MNLQNPIPSFIYKKSNIIKLVIFTAIFALVFINIYTPFGSATWYDLSSKTMFFLYSSILILIGMLVVVISRVVMYFWCKKRALKVVWFGVWICVEILAMGGIYAILSLQIEPQGDVLTVLKRCVLMTSAVLLLPYSISYLYFSLNEKSRLLKEEQLQDQVSNNTTLTFYDDKKELKLSIKKENLLYIESEDNYVNIYYSNKGKVSKYMLRNTLKSLEQEFAPKGIVRCHRSYMINIEQVSLLRKEKGGALFAEFALEQIIDIPITKTYSEEVTRAFL